MTTEYEKLERCILCTSSSIQPFKPTMNIVRCAHCGHIFDNPRPSLAAIAHYYSQKGKYNTWIDHEKTLAKQWQNLVARLLRFKKHGDLLDIGAGLGFFLSLAQKHFSVCGTEISSEAVALAEQKYHVPLLQGEVGSIDFRGRTFDIITMHQVLEHVQNPHETISVCRSLLKDDGLLYISVPNEAFYSIRMLFPAILKLLGKKKYSSFSFSGYRKICFETMEEIHLSHFSEPVLRRQLVRQGFTILESNIDFIDPLMHGGIHIQIIRRIIMLLAVLLRRLFNRNIYNCFWIIAQKKNPHENETT